MHERVKLPSHYNLIKKNEKINLLLIKFIYLKGNNVLREAAFKCIANQWTGFYMITASVMKELSTVLHFNRAKQMTGFYKESNTGQKCVNEWCERFTQQSPPKVF